MPEEDRGGSGEGDVDGKGRDPRKASGEKKAMSQASIDAIVKHDRSGQKRMTVYKAILNAGDFGATLDSLARTLGWKQHCISGRITELRGRGMVYDSGLRKNRQTVWLARTGQLPFVHTQYRNRVRFHADVIVSSQYKNGSWLTLYAPGDIDQRLKTKGARLTLELVP